MSKWCVDFQRFFKHVIRQRPQHGTNYIKNNSRSKNAIYMYFPKNTQRIEKGVESPYQVAGAAGNTM